MMPWRDCVQLAAMILCKHASVPQAQGGDGDPLAVPNHLLVVASSPTSSEEDVPRGSQLGLMACALSSSDDDAQHCERPDHALDVRDLEGVFTWAIRFFEVAKDVFGEARVLKVARRETALSSHFSGLGTLEVSLRCLAAGARSVMRVDLAIRSALACEKSPACRQVLLARDPGAGWKFGAASKGIMAASI